MIPKYMIRLVLLSGLLLIYDVCLAEDVYPLSDSRFVTEADTFSFPLSFGSQVVISSAVSLTGELSLKADQSEKVDFEYRKILKTDDEGEAANYAEQIEIDIRESRDGIKILLRAPNPSPWSGTDNSAGIEGHLLIPADCRIEIDSDFLDFRIEGPFQSIKNNTSFGRFDIAEIKGSISISCVSGDIYLGDVAGEIIAGTKTGDIVIRNMVCTDDAAHLRNQSGDIDIRDLVGGVDIKNSYGRIRISNADLTGVPSEIEGLYSPIMVEVRSISETGLGIRNAYEDVIVELPHDLSAVLSLSASVDGEIHIERLPVKPVGIEMGRMELICGEGDSRIDISIEGTGDIEIEGP